MRDLLRQWIIGLACGYENANDAARLVDDPLHKLAVSRDLMTGVALASQPTLSRFENAVSPRALYRLGCTVALRASPRSAATFIVRAPMFTPMYDIKTLYYIESVA